MVEVWWKMMVFILARLANLCYSYRMVRLINDKNIIVVKKAINGYMQYQKHHTHIININNKNIEPCIYAMWHADQFGIFSVENKNKTTILISNSIDGDIVAYCVENLGFKAVRGSAGKRGSIESSLKMAELLAAGESVALMVDGPNGPLHSVKNGAVRLAKMSGAPIIPLGWYCPQWNFVNLPSWDKMTAPIGDCYIVSLFGEPIYVPKDLPQDRESEIRQQIKDSLNDIYARLPEEHEKAKKNRLWDNLKK